MKKILNLFFILIFIISIIINIILSIKLISYKMNSSVISASPYQIFLNFLETYSNQDFNKSWDYISQELKNSSTLTNNPFTTFGWTSIEDFRENNIGFEKQLYEIAKIKGIKNSKLLSQISTYEYDFSSYTYSENFVNDTFNVTVSLNYISSKDFDTSYRKVYNFCLTQKNDKWLITNIEAITYR